MYMYVTGWRVNQPTTAQQTPRAATAIRGTIHSFVSAKPISSLTEIPPACLPFNKLANPLQPPVSNTDMQTVHALPTASRECGFSSFNIGIVEVCSVQTRTTISAVLLLPCSLTSLTLCMFEEINASQPATSQPRGRMPMHAIRLKTPHLLKMTNQSINQSISRHLYHPRPLPSCCCENASSSPPSMLW
jgi:hypothetical protein